MALLLAAPCAPPVTVSPEVTVARAKADLLATGEEPADFAEEASAAASVRLAGGVEALLVAVGYTCVEATGGIHPSRLVRTCRDDEAEDRPTPLPPLRLQRLGIWCEDEIHYR